MPLISINPNLEITPINSPIFSNRVKAHHFGLTGTVQKIDWKLKSSVVQQLGTYNNPFPEALNYWYNYISLEYDFDNFGNIRVYGAFDNGDNIDSNFGGGLEYSFSF
ncbi:MAG: hypothetical protein HKN48_03770 [Flavobacteriaceae bacterium]|nr:hypothetical protein [Flavobacteriaceae bacterium]